MDTIDDVAPHPTHTELLELARRVIKLFPDRRDPEVWHIEKDAIAKALQRLAQRVDVRARE
jgi:hypothetical protein